MLYYIYKLYMVGDILEKLLKVLTETWRKTNDEYIKEKIERKS